MSNMHADEEVLKWSHFFSIRNQLSKTGKRKRGFPYKFTLALCDLVIVHLAFVLSLSAGFLVMDNTVQVAILYCMALTVLAFFPTFKLYSFHNIFSKKQHSASLLRAFGWSFLTLGVVAVICLWAQLFDKFFIFTIFLIASGLILFGRFFTVQFTNIIAATGLSFLIVGMIGLLSPDENPIELINIRMTLLTCFSAAIVLIISRFFIVHIGFNRFLRRSFRRQIAIIGSNDEAERIATYIIDQNAPYWVAGSVGKSGLDVSVPKNTLGEIETLPAIVRDQGIDEIIVTDEGLDKRALISLLEYATSEGLTVWFPPNLMPIIDIKLNVDNFCDLKMIRLCSQKRTWIFNKLKHGFDALITLPAFIVILPFFATIGAAIKLNSKGPVFYLARAIGRHGKEFAMFKFRSMGVETNSEIHQEYVTKLIKGEITNEGEEDKPLKITNDPRVTKVGKFLRKFSLDELPQLINVIKGDMSLVGPRPCLPYEYEIYKDWQKKRTIARPGITGLWQVTGRSEVAFEDMILLDLYYIYNRSLLLDFNILFETVFVVLGKKGAY